MKITQEDIERQRVIQLQRTIRSAESEIMVALLSFSIFANYAFESTPRISLDNLASLLTEELQYH